MFNPLSIHFFNQDPQNLAKKLLGKVLRRKINDTWISARIIETEAYYCQNDKASHSSLGRTEKKAALFMVPGTLYLYYSRGRDSLNISARGEGNAVLIKSAFPYFDEHSPEATALKIMQRHYNQPRALHKLCNGQTLLCQALDIKVRDWDKKMFNNILFLDDVGLKIKDIIQTTRLGIPQGRDEHLPYRFIDAEMLSFCSKGKSVVKTS